MKKLIYLIALILVLGLIVPGCLPVVPPTEQSNTGNLTKAIIINVPGTYGPTIQAAINAAGPGDTINVSAGNYPENLTIPPGKDNLKLLGAGVANTILSPAAGTAITIGSPITIKGFHILQSDSSSAILIAWGSSGVSGTSGNPGVIEANKFESPTGSRGNGVNFKDYESEYWEIKDNEFIDRKLAIYLNRASHLVISGNILTGYKEGIGMNWDGEPAHDLTITGNNFLGTDYPFTPQELLEKAAIMVGEVSYNVYISENTITGSPNGIRIPDHAEGVTNLENVYINNNNIYGNTNYGIKNDVSVEVDATNNWWGHASGPSGEGGRWNSAHTKIIGKGDAVSLNVNWDPRLPQPVDHTPHHPVPLGLDTVKVGLVFDIETGEWSKAWNDSVYQGIEWATADFNIEHIELEPEEDEDREEYLRILAMMDCDLVIGVGFLFTDAITTVADEFPDTKFAIIDGYGLIPDIPNVVSLLFKEHEGSFLVGMIAGKRAIEDGEDTVGFVGGRDIPLIHKFEAGYRAGIHYVFPECTILSDYAGAFDDPDKGKELALAQYDEGAWVIYHASGATGEGVFEAGRERKKYVIGVDYNQNYMGYIEETGESFGLTSMLKQVNVPTYLTIKSVVEETFEGGIEVFFGLDTEVTIGGKLYYGVDYALDEYNEHSVTPEMIAQVEEARDKIISGEIIVPDS